MRQYIYCVFSVVTALHLLFIITFDQHGKTFIVPPRSGYMDVYTSYNNICRTFNYDRAEWTIRLKNESVYGDVKNCIFLYESLLKGKVVKNIIHTNGSVENRGCRNSTHMCPEMAYFDERINMRVSTPPCCRQQVLDIFSHVTMELQRFNVSHLLVFGSVIGWLRNKQMIPYDRDLDVIVDNRFWKSGLMLHFLTRLSLLYDHVFFFKDNGSKLWIVNSPVNNLSVDIWPYCVEKEKVSRKEIVTIPHLFWKIQFAETIFPAQRIAYHGILTYIPNNPENYVNVQYGEGTWRTELTCKVVEEGGKCIK